MTLMMSVSGVRGIIGESMTPILATELACAFGSHLGGGPVVLGRDSRPSGPMLAAAVQSGLAAVGCDVIDLGVQTTPGTAMMVLEHRAAGGMIITASHNPQPWNGLKFLTREGYAPPPEIADRVFQIRVACQYKFAGNERIGKCAVDDSTVVKHVAKVLALHDVEAIRRRRLSVVLDSVNGAGGAEGLKLLEALGCRVHHINPDPTGYFAHSPEPLAQNLTGLCDEVRRHGADVGFAQDPDADRLAVVDQTGRYIGEEYTIVLSALARWTRQPGAVAVNLSTSRMIDDLAGRFPGASVLRTPVGEANVARAVLSRSCVLGGEGNGGVIDARVVPVRDSLVAMGLVLSVMAERPDPVGTIVDQLPRYVMVKEKFEMAVEQIKPWLGRVKQAATGAKCDDSDGVRIDWPEGWVHVRPSNTEPIARVIAEGRDERAVAALVRRVTDLR